MKDFLHKILSSKNIVESIKNNEKNIISLIPEIYEMIGFEHNHPHHHLDVWNHTLYALSFSPCNFDIRLALLLHDIGKPHSFQEDNNIRHFKGHAEISANISKEILTRLGYPKDYINYICNIIAHHDTPITKEEIIKNQDFCKVLFEVQKCDILAHNPVYNKKRLEYLKNIANLFDEINKMQ